MARNRHKIGQLMCPLSTGLQRCPGQWRLQIESVGGVQKWAHLGTSDIQGNIKMKTYGCRQGAALSTDYSCLRRAKSGPGLTSLQSRLHPPMRLCVVSPAMPAPVYSDKDAAGVRAAGPRGLRTRAWYCVNNRRRRRAGPAGAVPGCGAAHGQWPRCAGNT